MTTIPEGPIMRETAAMVVAMLLALGIASAPVAAADSRKACELLTRDEVARVAGGPVEVDPTASGEDDRGGDNCVWTPPGKNPAVVLRVERLPSVDRATRAFADTKVEAFGGGPPPARVAGLGDEALYRDFQRAKGGALIVRRGAVVLTISGSVPKEAQVSLGRLALGRI